MTRVMYDSTNATDIPKDAQMVAGYIDGLYAWKPADWQRFPNALKVMIVVSAYTGAGDVLDVENGDSTPAQAVFWVANRRKAGFNPSVYVNRSNLAQVRGMFKANNIPEPHYWLATLDGSLPWESGVYAIQYQGSNLSGGHYDKSIVADFWPGVDVEDMSFTDQDRADLQAVKKALDAGAVPAPAYHGFADSLTKIFKSLAAAIIKEWGTL